MKLRLFLILLGFSKNDENEICNNVVENVMEKISNLRLGSKSISGSLVIWNFVGEVSFVLLSRIWSE